MIPFGFPFSTKPDDDFAGDIRDLDLRLNALVPDDEFDVKITAYEAATGHHSWTKQLYDTNANFVDHPDGMTGSATWMPAKTFNGETVATGKYVRIRKRLMSFQYGPVYEIINPPPGSVGDPTGFGVVFGPIAGPTGFAPLGTITLFTTGKYDFWGEIPSSVGTSIGTSNGMYTRSFLRVDVTAGTAGLWGGSAPGSAGGVRAEFKSDLVRSLVASFAVGFTITPRWWTIVSVAPVTLTLGYYSGANTNVFEQSEDGASLYYAKIG